MFIPGLLIFELAEEPVPLIFCQGNDGEAADCYQWGICEEFLLLDLVE